MELSEIINLVLGGSLLATILTIVTLKSAVRKAQAEADKAMAEAETVRIDNADKATRILIENIINPLKEELNEAKKELKYEMARLRKAINAANSCRYNTNCPVLGRMRVEQKKRDTEDLHEPRGEPIRRGQHGERRRNLANARESSDVGGEPDAESGLSASSVSWSELHGKSGSGAIASEEESPDGDRTRATDY